MAGRELKTPPASAEAKSGASLPPGEQDVTAYLDVDGTLVLADSTINVSLLNALQQSGVKNIVLFTSMEASTVHHDIEGGYEGSRLGLLDNLTARGFHTTVITPLDYGMTGPGSGFAYLKNNVYPKDLKEMKLHDRQDFHPDPEHQRESVRTKQEGLKRFFEEKVKSSFSGPEADAIMGIFRVQESRDAFYDGGVAEIKVAALDSGLQGRLNTFMESFHAQRKDFELYKGMMALLAMKLHPQSVAVLFDDLPQALAGVETAFKSQGKQNDLFTVQVNARPKTKQGITGTMAAEAEAKDYAVALFTAQYLVSSRNSIYAQMADLDIRKKELIGEQKQHLNDSTKIKTIIQKIESSEQKREVLERAMITINRFTEGEGSILELKANMEKLLQESRQVKKTGKLRGLQFFSMITPDSETSKLLAKNIAALDVFIKANPSVVSAPEKKAGPT